MSVENRKMLRMLAPGLFYVRRQIHENPELGNQEFQTAACIEQYLRNIGIKVHRPFGTAVVGELKGTLPGKTVGLRAEMDALPIQEKTGVEFASKRDGVMHACGHDVHVAGLLGAAALLAAKRDRLPGSVRFFFEPDEEGEGGAKRMVECGCMEDVSVVYGAHVDPKIPIGCAGIRYGSFYAASDRFQVTVEGRCAHAATPRSGVNAVTAAADIALQLSLLPEQGFQQPLVLTVTTFLGGGADNVIPEKASFSGILRTLEKEDRERLIQRMEDYIHGISNGYGAKAETKITKGYDGITNTGRETALAEKAAKEYLGEDKVLRIEKPTLMTEDFGCFLNPGGGSFYHIGAGCLAPLHSASFLPAEEAILTAAGIHASAAEAFLRQESESREEKNAAFR